MASLLDELSGIVRNPMLCISEQGEVVDVNRHLCQLLQCPRDALLGRSLAELVSEDASVVNELLRLWSRTRDAAPGALTWRHTQLKTRCDGARVRLGENVGILLHCRPQSHAVQNFTFLNQKIDALTGEVRRRQVLEAQLRDQREWLDVVLTSIGDAVIATDVTGSIQLMNAAAESMTGWHSTEAVGRPLNEVFRIVNEETGAAAVNPIAQVLETGAVVGLANHTALVSRDGRRVPIEDSAAPIRSRSGQILGVVMVFHDISAKVAHQAELRRQQEWFRTTLASVGDGVIATDATGRVVFMNPVAETLTGRSLDNGRGRPVTSVFDIVHEQTREVVENPVERVLREGVVVGLANHTVLRRPDGTEIPIDDSGAPIRQDDGRIEGAVLIFRDITQRYQAERALREREQRFRTMADGAPAMIWLAGPDSGCTWFNKPWLEFTGRTMQQELDSGWLDGVHDDDRDTVANVYAKSFRERQPFRLEFRLRRHDGEYRWVMNHGQPIVESNVSLVGYVGSCIDITDLVEARHASEMHRNMLEQQVRERTLDLQRSYERLREADRLASLGTLSAGLGHDIGNLLLPIRTRLDALRNISAEPAASEHFDAIEKSLNYLQRLTGGLRLLAQDPHQTMEFETIELTEWWPDVQPLLKNILPRNVQLIGSMPSHPVRVKLNRPAVAQIIFNLVQNAGDAMRGRGEGHVHVRAEPAEDNWLRLVVQDDGPGMTEDVRRRCFEPFFTTKHRELSTGLGLTVVHGMVTRAGGRIELETAPGEGASITLWLPMERWLFDQGELKLAAALSLSNERLRGLVWGTLSTMHVDVVLHDHARIPEHAHLWIADEQVPVERLQQFLAGPERCAMQVAEQPAAATDGLHHVSPSLRISDLRNRVRQFVEQCQQQLGGSR